MKKWQWPWGFYNPPKETRQYTKVKGQIKYKIIKEKDDTERKEMVR